MTKAIHFAILDTNAGLLQWLGKAKSEAAAIAAFIADVGGDVNAKHIRVYALDNAKEAVEVASWWNAGGASNDTPDCLR